MNNQKGIAHIFAGIFLLVAGVGLIYFVSKKPLDTTMNRQTENAEPAKKNTDNTSDWETYRGEKYTLKYPPDMNPTSPIPNSLNPVFMAVSSKYPDIQISLSTDLPGVGITTLKEISQETVIVDGQELNSTFFAECADDICEEITTKRTKIVYLAEGDIFSFGYDIENDDYAEDLFGQILSSVEVTKNE